MSREFHNLSVAVVTYKRGQVLIDTIESILANKTDCVSEVIIVDQNHDYDADVYNKLKAYHDNREIIWRRLDIASTTYARNIALSVAKNPVVLFLDDDVLVVPGLFDEHLEMYNKYHAQCVAGQVYDVYHKVNMEQLDIAWLIKERAIAWFESEDIEKCRTDVVGANHSVLRDVAISLGGYDEAFVGAFYGEESDFSMRLIKSGGLIYYNPKARVVHRKYRYGGSRPLRGDRHQEWTYSASFLLYAFRHGAYNHKTFSYIIQALRKGPLRKFIIMRPWLLPWSFFAFLKGCSYAWKNKRTGKSLFYDDAKTQGNTNAGE